MTTRQNPILLITTPMNMPSNTPMNIPPHNTTSMSMPLNPTIISSNIPEVVTKLLSLINPYFSNPIGKSLSQDHILLIAKQGAALLACTSKQCISSDEQILSHLQKLLTTHHDLVIDYISSLETTKHLAPATVRSYCFNFNKLFTWYVISILIS